MKPILNLAFLIIMLLCIWGGYKRGLILGIASLLAIVVSLYGANLLSKTYSYEVIDALRPFASGYLETTINNKVRPEFDIAGAETSSLSVLDYLDKNPDQTAPFCQSAFEHLGIHTRSAKILSQEAQDYARAQETDIRNAMVEVLCLRISYVAGFVIAFVMLLILLTVIGNLPNLAFKIPNMDLLNDIGGAVLGLAQGAAFCCILAWMLKFTGILIPQAVLAETGFVALFIRLDPLGKILGI